MYEIKVAMEEDCSCFPFLQTSNTTLVCNHISFLEILEVFLMTATLNFRIVLATNKPKSLRFMALSRFIYVQKDNVERNIKYSRLNICIYI